MREDRIYCEEHGERPWVLMCLHVINGTTPAVVAWPTDVEDDVGEVLCRSCVDEPEDERSIENFRPVCVEHARALVAHLRAGRRGRFKVRPPRLPN